MLNNLKAISENDFTRDCMRINENLFKQAEWNEARTIAITIARGREISTKPVIEEAWRHGKKVAVPKCFPKTKEMVFRVITDFDQLESVYYGLLEPKIGLTEIVVKDKLDLMVVPGVVFDPSGYRIGFGGGYYDRYLADYHGKTISLALDQQIPPKIPRESHDQPVNKIITPTRIISD